jgi:ribosomal protein S18 acetylase RimI-like enzyme
MEILFEQAVDSDLEYLLGLRKLTMVEHLEREGLFYTDEQHVERLRVRFECAHIVWLDGIKVGFLKFLVSKQKLSIMQIQIEPKQQGKGLGRKILQHLLTIHNDKVAVLTVLKHNPAFRLYQSLGFSTVAEDQYEYHMQLI